MIICNIVSSSLPTAIFHYLVVFSLIFQYFSDTNALKCMYYTKPGIYGVDAFGVDISTTAAFKLGGNYEQNRIPELSSSVADKTCNSYCYSVWKYDPYDLFNTSRYQLISGGCTDEKVNSYDCNKLKCFSSFSKDTFKNDNTNSSTSCCCYGDMCNQIFTITSDSLLLDSRLSFKDDLSEDCRNIAFLIAISAIFAVFIMILLKFVRSLYKNNKIASSRDKTMKVGTDSLHLFEQQSQQAKCLTLSRKTNNSAKDSMDNMTFIEIISHGKYGPIWKGKLNDAIVAIKVVQSESNLSLWKNESSIYSLPHMDHNGLPHFYRNIERMTEHGHLENCLVIEYGHFRSLQSYLVDHTFDWLRMCQLIKSLVEGLAYLHTEIRKDGKFKPSIAHCDLCSANIIVKVDGTCMICDFQFSVQLTHENLCHFGIEKRKTVRYFSPEILDDTISSRQSESSFKQADVYALGLILWEIATRCSDLYQGIEVPRYELPFEHEVGLEPSIDQIKLLVSHNKARPLFPDIWKDSNYAIRLLKETISECWDHEPDARLTALCIEERVSEMPSLWKRHKLETLSNCYVMAMMKENSNNISDSKVKEVKNMNLSDLFPISDENVHLDDGRHDGTNSKKYALNIFHSKDHSKQNATNNICYINKFENSLHCKYNDHQHLLHHPQHRHFISLNNTKKYLNLSAEKNSNLNLTKNNPLPKLTLPLQPHHARNPCMERNLMIDENDEERDEILEQGFKFQSKNTNQIEVNFLDAPSGNESNNENSQIISMDHNYSENRSLMQQHQQQAPMPIPFVQNNVNQSNIGTESIIKKSSIKIKDINKYRNSSHSRKVSFYFRRNLLNFLKQKLNLSLLLGFKATTKSATNVDRGFVDSYFHDWNTRINYQNNQMLKKSNNENVDNHTIIDAALLMLNSKDDNFNVIDTKSNDAVYDSETTNLTSPTMISIDEDYSFSIAASHYDTNIINNHNNKTRIKTERKPQPTAENIFNKLNNETCTNLFRRGSIIVDKSSISDGLNPTATSVDNSDNNDEYYPTATTVESVINQQSKLQLVE